MSQVEPSGRALWSRNGHATRWGDRPQPSTTVSDIRLMRTRALAIGVLAAWAAVAAPAGAQTLRLSLDALSRESDAVIVGKTLSTESFWTPDRSAILTRVTVQVEETLSGQPTSQVVLTVPGGQVGEYLHEISDMPVFVPDEEVVVFTTRLASGETVVAGGLQGKLEIVRDAAGGERQVIGFAGLLDDASLGVSGAAGAGETLEADEAKAALPLKDFSVRIKRLSVER